MATGFLADLVSAVFQDNIGAGFTKDQPEDGYKTGVVYDLDVENPGRINVRRVQRENGQGTHQRHGSVLGI